MANQAALIQKYPSGSTVVLPTIPFDRNKSKRNISLRKPSAWPTTLTRTSNRVPFVPGLTEGDRTERGLPGAFRPVTWQAAKTARAIAAMVIDRSDFLKAPNDGRRTLRGYRCSSPHFLPDGWNSLISHLPSPTILVRPDESATEG
jgi:hypothetical protein